MVCHRAPGRHPRRCASLGGRLAGDAVHRRSCGKLGCSPGRARNARDPDRDRAASAECGAQFASQPIRAVCARMRSGGGPSPGRTSRRAERPPGSLRARCATHRVEITLALGHQNFHDKLVRECVVALAQRNAGAEAALEGRDEVGALVLADEVRAARSEPGDECWVVALEVSCASRTTAKTGCSQSLSERSGCATRQASMASAAGPPGSATAGRGSARCGCSLAQPRHLRAEDDVGRLWVFRMQEPFDLPFLFSAAD
jgi:hypothetical protein